MASLPSRARNHELKYFTGGGVFICHPDPDDNIPLRDLLVYKDRSYPFPTTRIANKSEFVRLSHANKANTLCVAWFGQYIVIAGEKYTLVGSDTEIVCSAFVSVNIVAMVKRDKSSGDLSIHQYLYSDGTIQGEVAGVSRVFMSGYLPDGGDSGYQNIRDYSANFLEDGRTLVITKADEIKRVVFAADYSSEVMTTHAVTGFSVGGAFFFADYAYVLASKNIVNSDDGLGNRSETMVLKKIRVSLTDFVETALDTWTAIYTHDADTSIATFVTDFFNYCWIDDGNTIKCTGHYDLSGVAVPYSTNMPGTQVFDYWHNENAILSGSGAGGSKDMVLRNKNLLICNLRYFLDGDTGIGRSKAYFVNVATMQNKFIANYLSTDAGSFNLYLTTTRGLL